jgi:hypothetical protein
VPGSRTGEQRRPYPVASSGSTVKWRPVSACYSTQDWNHLFIASAGAAAALSGLIFVGLNTRTVLDAEKRVG